MKNFLMLLFFFAISFTTLTAQTAKCDISLEECKKICSTNPKCCKISCCVPSTCVKVANQGDKTTYSRLTVANNLQKTSCQKAPNSCNPKMAKQTMMSEVKSTTAQVVLKQE